MDSSTQSSSNSDDVLLSADIHRYDQVAPSGDPATTGFYNFHASTSNYDTSTTAIASTMHDGPISNGTPNPSSEGVQVIIKQKPRGSKGLWVPLLAHERIRVSDRKAGKNLRLCILAHRTDLDLAHVHVRCFEKPTSIVSKKAGVDWMESDQSSYIQQKQTQPQVALSDLGGANSASVWIEIDVKLLIMYRYVKFLVSIPATSPAAPPVEVESIEFITYNSGSEETKKRTRMQAKIPAASRPRVDNASPKSKRRKLKAPSEAKQEEAQQPELIAAPASPFIKLSPNEHALLPPSPAQPPISDFQAIISDPELDDTSSPDEFEPAPMWPSLDTFGPEMVEWMDVNANLSIDGVARAQQFIQYSDQRLKMDIQDITSALTAVSQLNGKSYQWKKPYAGMIESNSADSLQSTSNSSASTSTEAEDASRGERALGFIAQEIQRVVPEVVHETESGYLTVAYSDLVPLVLAALKEQYSRLQQLRETAALHDITAAQLQQNQKEALQQIKASLQRLAASGRKSRDSPRLASPHSVSVMMPRSPTDSDSAHLLVKNKRSAPSSNRPASASSKRATGGTPYCSGRSNWGKMFFAGAILFGVGAAIILGLVFGLSTTLHPNPNQNTTRPHNIDWTAANWFSDPGFENPNSSAWAGNYTFHQYAPPLRKREVLNSSYPDVDLAYQFFDAGNYAARLYIHPDIGELPYFAPKVARQIISLAPLLALLPPHPTSDQAPLLTASPVPSPVSSPDSVVVPTTEPPQQPPDPLAPEFAAFPLEQSGLDETTPHPAPSPYEVSPVVLPSSWSTLRVTLSLWYNTRYCEDPSYRNDTWTPHELVIQAFSTYASSSQIAHPAQYASISDSHHDNWVKMKQVLYFERSNLPEHILVEIRHTLRGSAFVDLAHFQVDTLG